MKIRVCLTVDTGGEEPAVLIDVGARFDSDWAFVAATLESSPALWDELLAEKMGRLLARKVEQIYREESNVEKNTVHTLVWFLTHCMLHPKSVVRVTT